MLGGLVAGGLAILWPLAVLAPAAAAVAWGRWLAPRAPRPLHDPRRLGLEVALFASAGGGWALGTGAAVATGFGALGAAHLALTFVLDQRAVPGP